MSTKQPIPQAETEGVWLECSLKDPLIPKGNLHKEVLTAEGTKAAFLHFLYAYASFPSFTTDFSYAPFLYTLLLRAHCGGLLILDWFQSYLSQEILDRKFLGTIHGIPSILAPNAWFPKLLT